MPASCTESPMSQNSTPLVLARHLGIDPEAALRGTNQKFERRFAAVERALAKRGKSPAQATLAEMDGFWNEAKLAEKKREGTEQEGSC